MIQFESSLISREETSEAKIVYNASRSSTKNSKQVPEITMSPSPVMSLPKSFAELKKSTAQRIHFVPIYLYETHSFQILTGTEVCRQGRSLIFQNKKYWDTKRDLSTLEQHPPPAQVFTYHLWPQGRRQALDLSHCKDFMLGFEERLWVKLQI